MRATMPVAAPPAPRKNTPPSREVVKALSIAGVEDADILKRFPGLKDVTIRQWRFKDTVWKAAYKATRPTKAQERAQEKALQTITDTRLVTETVEETIAETHAKTALALVTASGKALQRFAKHAPTPEDWSQAKTAYSVQRLAAGIDREGGPSVTMNLWGGGGISQAEPPGAFRDVSPATPAEPDAPTP